MSYDIELRDPVTNEIAEVPGHLMTGGTYKADYHPEIGIYTPALNTEANLNITYNYSTYYHEVYPDNGIRTIYGMTGVDSIPILEKLIERIRDKYCTNGQWLKSRRKKHIYYDKSGNELNYNEVLKREIEYYEKEVEVEIDEGRTDDYWAATAANAIRPLYQLIALAKMRPDGIWDGD